jgi:hypothetical protein
MHDIVVAINDRCFIVCYIYVIYKRKEEEKNIQRFFSFSLMINGKRKREKVDFCTLISFQ